MKEDCVLGRNVGGTDENKQLYGKDIKKSLALKNEYYA